MQFLLHARKKCDFFGAAIVLENAKPSRSVQAMVSLRLAAAWQGKNCEPFFIIIAAATDSVSPTHYYHNSIYTNLFGQKRKKISVRIKSHRGRRVADYNFNFLRSPLKQAAFPLATFLIFKKCFALASQP
ncbi:MAG: hypothetical protein HY231_27395 [Acidobacteria bacterium]|nr:hypothetical protein [Acidobacteriota bacterium]